MDWQIHIPSFVFGLVGATWIEWIMHPWFQGGKRTRVWLPVAGMLGGLIAGGILWLARTYLGIP